MRKELFRIVRKLALVQRCVGHLPTSLNTFKKKREIPPVIAGSQQFVWIWFLPVGNDVMHYSKESYYDVNLIAQ